MRFLYTIVLVAILCLQSYSQNGLEGYFPLNGNASDLSYNNGQGDIYGPIPTIDRFGNKNSAMYFDGDDDYIGLNEDYDIKPDLLIFGLRQTI